MINKIILAVPCYNCEKQISRVLQSIKDFKHLDKINGTKIISCTLIKELERKLKGEEDV